MRNLITNPPGWLPPLVFVGIMPLAALLGPHIPQYKDTAKAEQRRAAFAEYQNRQADIDSAIAGDRPFSIEVEYLERDESAPDGWRWTYEPQTVHLQCDLFRDLNLLHCVPLNRAPFASIVFEGETKEEYGNSYTGRATVEWQRPGESRFQHYPADTWRYLGTEVTFGNYRLDFHHAIRIPD